MAKKERSSGIELLKIFSIFIIVLFHVTQTLISSHNPNLFSSDAFLSFDYTIVSFRNIMILIFQSLGNIGNCIFFTCSSWFLLESCKVNFRKIIKLIMDIWIISVSFLAIFMIAGTELSTMEIVRCLFPTTFSQNWYLTCYILLYMVHPFLNLVIKNISQKELFHLSAGLLALYSFSNFIVPDLFFPSPLIHFIVIYFSVAYMKLYLYRFSKNKRQNLVAFFLSFFSYYSIILVTVFLSSHTTFFHLSPYRWYTPTNIFLLIGTFALFNLFKNLNFTNHTINRLSSLSLFIYIIHENYLVRTFLRPQIFEYIYFTYGYSHIIVTLTLFSIILLIFSCALSLFYVKYCTLASQKISDCLLSTMEYVSDRILPKLLAKN